MTKLTHPCAWIFWLAAFGGVWATPVFGADSAGLAQKLVDAAQVQRGICVVLGDHEDLPVEMARASEMLIHVRDRDGVRVDRLRQKAAAAGFGIQRVAVERGSTDQLPYGDNLIDVAIANAGDDASIEEVLRVLRPLGTGLFVGSADEIQILEKQAKAARVAVAKVWTDEGSSWLQFSKPASEGVGEWSHWEHGPDNNPVSEDTVIKAPYMTQFMAHPYYISMPSITTASGGRTFLAIGHIAHHRREWDMMNKIIARNGYNGTILWERPLPPGYLVHRSAFIATPDAYYMINGDHCLSLNPETGEELGTIKIPGVGGDWKWMVMKDGVLYVLAGGKADTVETMKGDRTFGGWSWGDLSQGYYQKPRVPWGFGNTLAAYDLQGRKLIWKHTEEQAIDARGMSIGKDRLFLYCPEAQMRCLDLASGEILWSNSDKQVLALLEEEGKGLTSTPGFRSACMNVYTPDALVMQGQTRQNVVAISTYSGDLLWTKKKFTNNPNAIFVDGNVILGVGERGSHVAIDPVSGEVKEDLGFLKRACTRLTACSDSFFVRGEGTLRYDRESKRVLVDGSARPACNDGALPANGLLYVGPWQCDCNLSLIGQVGKCSAGDFRFDHVATEAEHLEAAADIDNVAPFPGSDNDWPTMRGNNQRSAGTAARVARSVSLKWQYHPDSAHVPTVATAAGGLVFVAGEDGKVRAIDAATGKLRWEFYTPSPIKAAPTIDAGRVYVGSGDGFVYALEAASGRLLWRFQAAPVQRHIPIYGSLSSTWPVNTGVLVEDGTAYFGAGIIDYDGTYMYALDATTGKIKWQNNSSGHVNDELRKGVSVQGNLTIQGGQLLMAGGNQVSPAAFNLETGQCLAASFEQGVPKANHGQFVGVLRNEHAISGGRVLYSSPENVASKGSFSIQAKGQQHTFAYGGIPPAWDDANLVFVNFKHGKLTCCATEKVMTQLDQAKPLKRDSDRWSASLAEALEAAGAINWQTDLGESNKFEAVSLAVCPETVLAVIQYQQQFRAQPQRFVVAFDAKSGEPIWKQEMHHVPLPGGLLVDSQGQVVLTMLDGSVHCFGPSK